MTLRCIVLVSLIQASMLDAPPPAGLQAPPRRSLLDQPGNEAMFLTSGTAEWVGVGASAATGGAIAFAITRALVTTATSTKQNHIGPVGLEDALLMLLQAQSIKSQALFQIPMPSTYVYFAQRFAWASGHVDVVSLLSMDFAIRTSDASDIASGEIQEPHGMVQKDELGDFGSGDLQSGGYGRYHPEQCVYWYDIELQENSTQQNSSSSAVGRYLHRLGMSDYDTCFNTVLVFSSIGAAIGILYGILLLRRVASQRCRLNPRRLGSREVLRLSVTFVAALQEGTILSCFIIIVSQCGDAVDDYVMRSVAYALIVIISSMVVLVCWQLNRSLNLGCWRSFMRREHISGWHITVYVWHFVYHLLSASLLVMVPAIVGAFDDFVIDVQVFGMLGLHATTLLLIMIALWHDWQSRKLQWGANMFACLCRLSATGAFSIAASVDATTATAIMALDLLSLCCLIGVQVAFLWQAVRNVRSWCCPSGIGRNRRSIRVAAIGTSRFHGCDRVGTASEESTPPGGRCRPDVDADSVVSFRDTGGTAESKKALLTRLKHRVEPILRECFGLEWADIKAELRGLPVEDLRTGLQRPETAIATALMANPEPAVVRKMMRHKARLKRRGTVFQSEPAAKGEPMEANENCSSAPEVGEVTSSAQGAEQHQLEEHHAPEAETRQSSIPADTQEKRASPDKALLRMIADFKRQHEGVCWKYVLKGECVHNRGVCPIGEHDDVMRAKYAKDRAPQALLAKGAGVPRSHPLVPALELPAQAPISSDEDEDGGGRGSSQERSSTRHSMSARALSLATAYLESVQSRQASKLLRPVPPSRWIEKARIDVISSRQAQVNSPESQAQAQQALAGEASPPLPRGQDGPPHPLPAPLAAPAAQPCAAELPPGLPAEAGSHHSVAGPHSQEVHPSGSSDTYATPPRPDEQIARGRKVHRWDSPGLTFFGNSPRPMSCGASHAPLSAPPASQYRHTPPEAGGASPFGQTSQAWNTPSKSLALLPIKLGRTRVSSWWEPP